MNAESSSLFKKRQITKIVRKSRLVKCQKTKFPTPFEVNENISPPKRLKTSQNSTGCILQYTEGSSEQITTFSKTFKSFAVII